jgi:hypothetical protein
MPDDLDKVLADRKQEQDEFEDAFEDILGKTDEEIEKSLQEAKDKEEAEREAGSANKDVRNDTDDPESNYSFSDNSEGIAQPKPAASKTAETDWQAEADRLKADLDKEKQRTASWDGRIKAANDKTKALEEQVATLIADKTETIDAKTAAQTLSDQEKIDLFKENFPELGDVTEILQRRIDDGIKKVTPAKVEPKIEPAVADTGSVEDHATGKVSTPHYNAIAKAHPDIDEIVNTGVLTTWVNNQEDYNRKHFESIMAKGSADDVIGMATEFKRVTGWKSQITPNKTTKQDKLDSMRETNSQSGGPKSEGPDKMDFYGTAKEIGL